MKKTTEEVSPSVATDKKPVKKTTGKDHTKPVKRLNKNTTPLKGGKPNFRQKTPAGRGVNSNPVPEKTDWAKLKQSKKDLKIKRKESRDKDLFKLNIEAKRLYEQLKCRATKNKSELATNLYNMLNRANSVQKFVLAHDTSRIIQCLLKHSSPATRELLSKDLLPISVDMATSRYAHFCILRMLAYGSNAIKKGLVDSLMGSIIKLVSHNISGKILDKIYFDVATKKQRTHMRQEFYSDLYTNAKDDKITKLSDLFIDSPNMKKGFLSALKAKLEHVAHKNMAENSLVHAVLLEYIEQYTNDNETDETPEECMEIVRIYSGLIPHLVTTRDGCLAATWCFWLSATKERRGILKSLKEHLEKILIH